MTQKLGGGLLPALLGLTNCPTTLYNHLGTGCPGDTIYLSGQIGVMPNSLTFGAALVPRPRVNLTRFHGVFSPNSKLREYVVPQKPIEEQENPKPKAYSMTWAQRLKRVFAIDIEKCERCGGPVRIIASIEDPDVIQKILKYLGLDHSVDKPIRSPPADLTDQQTTLF